MKSMTGGPWNERLHGIAYRPEDDTFYIGDFHRFAVGIGHLPGIIYHVAGFSHPTPGETLGQCTLPDVNDVTGWHQTGDFAYNSSFDVLWLVVTNTHLTKGKDHQFLQVHPEDCSVVEAFDHPAVNTTQSVNPALASDEFGNLWTTESGLEAGGEVGTGTAYLLESGLPEFVDVPWLDVATDSGRIGPGDRRELELSIDTTGLEPGMYTAQVVLQTDAAREPDVFVPIRVLVTEYVQGVNVGGSASMGQRDSSEEAWAADQAFDGSWGYEGRSRSVTRQRPIDGTSNDGLYQQQRTGQGFDYRFEDLSDGTYDVELHFAEILGRQPGRRRFDVIANGVPVLVSYDVAESVGPDSATVRTFQVEVTSGSLRLGLERRVGFGQPAVAAIRLTHRPDLSDQ